MRIGIATDHGGFGLKEELVTRLKTAGHEVVEQHGERSPVTVGTDSSQEHVKVALRERVQARRIIRWR